jgi:hypothetical protein
MANNRQSEEASNSNEVILDSHIIPNRPFTFSSVPQGRSGATSSASASASGSASASASGSGSGSGSAPSTSAGARNGGPAGRAGASTSNRISLRTSIPHPLDLQRANHPQLPPQQQHRHTPTSASFAGSGGAEAGNFNNMSSMSGTPMSDYPPNLSGGGAGSSNEGRAGTPGSSTGVAQSANAPTASANTAANNGNKGRQAGGASDFVKKLYR